MSNKFISYKYFDIKKKGRIWGGGRFSNNIYIMIKQVIV